MVQWVMVIDTGSGATGLRPACRGLRVAALLCLLALLVGTTACESKVYSETIRVTAERMNENGLFSKVEYLRNGKVANSVYLVDGDGDGIIDGKSGPKSGGTWPAGWEWFDDMYTDTVVGETTITFDQHKVVVTATKSYEFIVGEYDVRSSS